MAWQDSAGSVILSQKLFKPLSHLNNQSVPDWQVVFLSSRYLPICESPAQCCKGCVTGYSLPPSERVIDCSGGFSGVWESSWHLLPGSKCLLTWPLLLLLCFFSIGGTSFLRLHLSFPLSLFTSNFLTISSDPLWFVWMAFIHRIPWFALFLTVSISRPFRTLFDSSYSSFYSSLLSPPRWPSSPHFHPFTFFQSVHLSHPCSYLYLILHALSQTSCESCWNCLP